MSKKEYDDSLEFIKERCEHFAGQHIPEESYLGYAFKIVRSEVEDFKKVDKALDNACELIREILMCLATENCKFCPHHNCVKEKTKFKWNEREDVRKYILKIKERW